MRCKFLTFLSGELLPLLVDLLVVVRGGLRRRRLLPYLLLDFVQHLLFLGSPRRVRQRQGRTISLSLFLSLGVLCHFFVVYFLGELRLHHGYNGRFVFLAESMLGEELADRVLEVTGVGDSYDMFRLSDAD